MADERLSPAEVAQLLHLPERLVYTLIVEGKLPAVRSPVRVLRSDLDRCLESCRVKPGDLAHLNQYSGGRYRYARKDLFDHPEPPETASQA